eukprot:1161840-Pelagomonas_calceolata.AAC.22
MTRRSPHCYHGLPVREQLFITRTGILDTRHVSRVWKRIISTCRLQDLPQCLGFNPRHLAQVWVGLSILPNPGSIKGYKGYKGVGLQPENLADRLLKSIDLEISQNVKARQERNLISVWKLGKTHTTHSNCKKTEHVSRLGLQHIHTYHKYSNHPTICRTI